MRTIVIPIVVGALGVVSTAFKHHTSRLKLPNWIMPLLQKAALLGTARILRQTLQLSGFSGARTVVPIVLYQFILLCYL